MGFFRRYFHKCSEETAREAEEIREQIRSGYDPREDPESSYCVRSENQKSQEYDKPDYGVTDCILVEKPKYLKGRQRMAERGANLFMLDVVISLLLDKQPLPSRNKPHKLHGAQKGQWECHIKDGNMGDDWVLIYAYDRKKLVLYAINTGTHDECDV